MAVAADTKGFRAEVAAALEAAGFARVGPKAHAHWVLPGTEVIPIFFPHGRRSAYGFELSGSIAIELPDLRAWLKTHRPDENEGVFHGGTFASWLLVNDAWARELCSSRDGDTPVAEWVEVIKQRLLEIPATLDDLTDAYRQDAPALRGLASNSNDLAWAFLLEWYPARTTTAPIPRYPWLRTEPTEAQLALSAAIANTPRAEVSARHAYRRALEKAVRAVSKGSGWRTREGCLFREQGGWFISASPSVIIYGAKTTTVSISVKPMAIDPVFWDIFNVPEGHGMPLSFRFGGAFTCRPPRYSEQTFEDDGDAEAVAARVLDIANRQAAEIVERWSAEDFLRHCQSHDTPMGNFATIVCTLVAMGRDAEARALCLTAKDEGETGGFLAKEGSFTDMALTWIEAAMQRATRH